MAGHRVHAPIRAQKRENAGDQVVDLARVAAFGRRGGSALAYAAGVDIRYTAHAQVDTTEPYECRKCGYVGQGEVVARATGSHNRGSLLFGNDRAGEIARDNAEAQAWRDAMSRVALAACPRCGARDRSAWLGWLPRQTLRALPTGLGVGFVLGLVVAVLVGIRSGGLVVLWGTIPIGLVVGYAIIALLELDRTRTVKFDPPK
jgi:hypothetical protein